MIKCLLQTIIALILFCGPGFGQAQQKEEAVPVIVSNANNSYTLLVEGKPFIILGAQLWNSSSWPYILNRTWPLLKAMHCNTLEAPVYWQVMEPEKGTFQFSEVDSLIDGARKQQLHLVLLWFGAYKNGNSSYAPAWVLSNPVTYPRMQNKYGEKLPVLSAVANTNLNADKQAFCALMHHLKQIDGNNHTVIMVQVENEPGVLGSDRDYSSQAEAVFNKAVPANIIQQLSKTKGTWREVFGRDAAESFTAFTLARYIDEIAGAGQKEYKLPMYTNCWLKENGFQRAGEYPSGGATSNMLALWKAAAPSLTLLAPDIYLSNSEVFRQVCASYMQAHNPLLIPEMGKGIDFARYQFYAIGQYHALGIATYGVDFFLTDPADERTLDKLDQRFADMANNYRLFSDAMPELTRLQSANKLSVAVEEYGLKEQLVPVGNYDILFTYGFPAYKNNAVLSGRALIGQLGENEFLIAGFDARFQFRRKYGAANEPVEISIEEGIFEEGKWVRKRIWNGDEAYHSTLPPHGVLLKIIVNDPFPNR